MDKLQDNSDAEQRFERAVRQNVGLAPYTTLGIGGPARYFAEVARPGDLAVGVKWAEACSLPLFVLGGGSNVLVADTGFHGLVLRVSISGVEVRIQDDAAFITAGAGEDWDDLVAWCVAHNYAGIECLSGIPGRVGATPIQNVGAYGQEVSETVVSLDALDIATGESVGLPAGECGFGYRTSRFKTGDLRGYAITGVTYRLAIDGEPAVRYPELRRRLDERGIRRPQLSDVRDAVLTIRSRKAMVIDPADPDSRSVGSFFVNPVVTGGELEIIESRLGRGSGLPRFPAADGKVKLSAAWLIERAGFARGWVHGNVGLSTRHALAIINRGGGTAREVMELAGEIKARVEDLSGIKLAPEPVFVGFDS